MTRLLRATAASGVLAAFLLGVSGHAQAPQQAQQEPQQGQQQAPPQGQQQGQQAQQQPPPAGDQPPIFRSIVNFVRVDVIVTDRSGNPVGDLKPEDFEVIEQGQAQTIETFKLIALDGGRSNGRNDPPRQIRTDYDEEAEAARDDVRLFAIFLDDYHVRRESSLTMRDQIARFVDTQLGPSDMIGLMYPLESTVAVRMTRNHAAVVKALQQFSGRKYDYTPMNRIEEQYVYYPAQAIENIRNDVSLSALKALIVHMGGLKEGRKALLLVSEGYSGLLPAGLQNANASLPNVGGGSGLESPVASLAEDRALSSANFNLDLDIRDLTDLANKNNVAIYPIDPRGLSTGEFGIDQNIGPRTDRTYLNSTMETLRTMAFNTDGRAIVNRNDLVGGMKQIMQDSSAYYLLGYNSTYAKPDGKFHEIKVRLKRPGLQVRARKGYWAFTAEDAARATAPPAPEVPKAYTSALSAISAPSKSRTVRTWIGTERGAAGKTKVTFLWEPIPRPPGEPAARAGDAPARVSLMAVSEDGAPAFRGRLPEAASAASAGGAVTGGKVSFEARPGKMALRISVESATSDVLDSEMRDVEVPDLTVPQVALSTPQLFRARTVRDYQQLKADAQATPTALREFLRSDRIFLRVQAYAPGTEPPVVSARMLNRAGQAISTLQVAPSTAGATTRDIDVPLTAVPPGEYLIEITAPDQDKTVQAVVGFRITT